MPHLPWDSFHPKTEVRAKSQENHRSQTASDPGVSTTSSLSSQTSASASASNSTPSAMEDKVQYLEDNRYPPISPKMLDFWEALRACAMSRSSYIHISCIFVLCVFSPFYHSPILFCAPQYMISETICTTTTIANYRKSYRPYKVIFIGELQCSPLPNETTGTHSYP